MGNFRISHIYSKLTGNNAVDTEGPQSLISLSGCLAWGILNVCVYLKKKKSVTFRASLPSCHLLPEPLCYFMILTTPTIQTVCFSEKGVAILSGSSQLHQNIIRLNL